MLIRVTRRHVALALLALTGGGAATYWWLRRADRTPLDLALPASGNPFHPTYEEFLALSQIVLVRPELDGEIARKLYLIFMDEPWGPKHIGHAYSALRATLIESQRATDNRGPVPVSVLDAGERWFVSHLVTTWYLGIYFHEQRPLQRVTVEGALMHDAMRGLVPRPFIDSVGYGRWVDPPDKAESSF